MFGMGMLCVALLVLGLTSLVQPAPTSAQATTFTSSSSVPFSAIVEGCTEPVALTGNLHLLVHVTADARGGFHFET